MLKRLLLRFYLSYKGIRFYKTEQIPKSQEFRKAVFKTIRDHTVEFYFYKETREDLLFKRGYIRKEHNVGYVIQAKFDKALPENIYKYNNLTCFFEKDNILINDETVISDVLLNIYLDFIKNELFAEQMITTKL